MIGHSLGRMGICMEEHTCEAILPHITEMWSENWKYISGVPTQKRRAKHATTPASEYMHSIKRASQFSILVGLSSEVGDTCYPLVRITSSI